MPDEPQTDAPDQPEDQPDRGEPDWKAEAEKFKALARKHEDRAKASAKSILELEQLKKATMTDLEKSLDEAKKQTRAEVLAEVGTGRAADAIRFSVGDRVPADELDSLLEDLNLSRFIEEDGSVNKAKVVEYAARIAPDAPPNGAFPDLGQGSRAPASTADMNTHLRRMAGRG